MNRKPKNARQGNSNNGNHTKNNPSRPAAARAVAKSSSRKMGLQPAHPAGLGARQKATGRALPAKAGKGTGESRKAEVKKFPSGPGKTQTVKAYLPPDLDSALKRRAAELGLKPAHVLELVVAKSVGYTSPRIAAIQHQASGGAIESQAGKGTKSKAASREIRIKFTEEEFDALNQCACFDGDIPADWIKRSAIAWMAETLDVMRTKGLAGEMRTQAEQESVQILEKILAASSPWNYPGRRYQSFQALRASAAARGVFGWLGGHELAEMILGTTPSSSN